ncbi:MAG: hypothetical protein ACTHW7_04285 [Actinomycetaceae bacterium]
MPSGSSIRAIKPSRGWPVLCLALALVGACLTPWAILVSPTTDVTPGIPMFEPERWAIGVLSAALLVLSALVVLGYGRTYQAIVAVVVSALALPFAASAALAGALEGWASSMGAWSRSETDTWVEVTGMPTLVVLLVIAAVVMSSIMLASTRLRGPAPKLFRRRPRVPGR